MDKGLSRFDQLRSKVGFCFPYKRNCPRDMLHNENKNKTEQNEKRKTKQKYIKAKQNKPTNSSFSPCIVIHLFDTVRHCILEAVLSHGTEGFVS